MFFVGAQVAPTGRKWYSCTMRFGRSPVRPWWPSIAPLRLPRSTAPAPLSTPCPAYPPMRGSLNTSPTGRHARNCWPRRAHTAKPATLTKSLSVSRATLPSAAFCRSVCLRCRLDLPDALYSNRCLKNGMDFGIDGDVCSRDAVDREFDAVGFREMEEAADVIILVVGRKKTFRFGRRELERGKRDKLAELPGQGEVQVNKLAKGHGNSAANGFGAHK